MSRNFQDLEAEALKLPMEARDRLATRLLESLKPVPTSLPRQEAAHEQRLDLSESAENPA